jgi:hypothetical protein
MNPIINRMNHVKNLINSWKNNIIFKGSIFENNIQMSNHNEPFREVFVKYFNNLTSHEITNPSITKYLLNRLKIKISLNPINMILCNQTYITIFNSSYKVEFFKQNTYAECENFNHDEIYKLLSYEKTLLNESLIFDDIEL